MVLDVWQPTNTTGNQGPFPIVMTVHGGAFVSGDQEDKDPPNAFFASRGFVAFAIQYRLAKDKGLYPISLKGWNPKNVNPHAQWTPYIWAMYPAVRDIKAALRWIHAHASEYNADTSSITLQGGSAGATAVIELALTGGDDKFAGDYTVELQGLDRTLSTANLDQPATANGLIDYWGGIFTEDLMSFKDGKPRWTASSLPTIAFHGTEDTTVSPQTGEVLCGNLTAVGVPCKLVSLKGQKHGCWNAEVTLPSGTMEPIFDFAFDWMASISNWTVIGPAPGNCSAEWKQCGGKNWNGTTCCEGSCICSGTDYHKQCKPPSGGKC
jgi:acetyl esterase/lipase